VLDTNVLVSALLQPLGNPARILRLILERAVELALDERIMAEYAAVLARPKFGLPEDLRTSVLAEIARIAVFAGLPPEPVSLPDPADQPFLEAALASGAHALITGNMRHFPADHCSGMQVITPAEFMEVWAEHNRA